MGPEYLVLAALVVGIAASASIFYAGWSVRGKLADSTEGQLRRDLEAAHARLERAGDAARYVDAAADRRANLDPDADPLGVGLLLDPGSSGSDSPGGETESSDGSTPST